MIYIEALHLVSGKEICHSALNRKFVGIGRFVLNDEIYLIAQILIQLLRIAFFECHYHPHRNVLCQDG